MDRLDSGGQLGAFSRFLEAASFSQGSVLNVSAVSRECTVERKVVEHYFDPFCSAE